MKHLVLAVGAIVLAVSFFVWGPAGAHDPEDVEFEAVVSPDCREADESWEVEWFVTNNSTVLLETDNDDLGIIDAGDTDSAVTEHSASDTTAQFTFIEPSNVAHGEIEHRSGTVDRPELCPEPTATATEVPNENTPAPTPTEEPDPPLTVVECVGNVRVTTVDGETTEIVNPHPDCVTPTIEPAPTGTTAPPPTGGSLISPPSTGDAGLM